GRGERRRGGGGGGVVGGGERGGGGGLGEFCQRLGFDLPHALRGHGQVTADLLERVVRAGVDAEAHAEHERLARVELRESLARLARHALCADHLHRAQGGFVSEGLAERALVLVAGRYLERDRIPRDAGCHAH